MLKVDYNNCLTNFSCSIRKYFGLDIKHNTLNVVDELLEKYNPKNVVIFLFDGMGSIICDNALNKDDFFVKNKICDITSVFPTTTTAATTSVLTGLNPCEHGWLGWNMYINKIDKTITLFLGQEKVSKEYCIEFEEAKKNLYLNNIIDEINEKNEYSAIKLFPFGDNKYDSLDQMLNIIERETKKDGKKLIYAYDEEPDSTMHDLGSNSKESKELIIERNNKVEKLIEKLNDTMIFVIADHGHLDVDSIFLEDYEDLYNTLERTTSLESRCVSFKIKDNMEDKFKELFNKYFGNDFKLLSKNEVIDAEIFGDGKHNIYFEDALGDFIAIASDSNKALLTIGNNKHASAHAGNSDREVYVPLISYYKK